MSFNGYHCHKKSKSQEKNVLVEVEEERATSISPGGGNKSKSLHVTFGEHSRSERKGKVEGDNSPVLMVTRQESEDVAGSPTVQFHFRNLAHIDSAIYTKFLEAHTCHDLIPVSSKIIIFDSHLSVKKAFYALAYNNCRAALVFDNDEQCFDGMLTISDFIYILVKNYRSPFMKMEEIEEHTIKTWKKVMNKDKKKLVYINDTSDVLKAVNLLAKHKVHRLPVFHDKKGDPLHILSHKRILKYLYLHMHTIPAPRFMEESITSLGIGTYNDVITIKEDTVLFEVLQLLMNHRISALPVLDDTGHCISLYSKFDAINLAAEKSYNNLDITVKKALEFHHQTDEIGSIHQCFVGESVRNVVEMFATTSFHRLIVAKPDGTFAGVISLSDLLVFLLVANSA